MVKMGQCEIGEGGWREKGKERRGDLRAVSSSRETSRGRRKRKGEGFRVGVEGGIKASSGNPDWLKGAMRDYERIYLGFSAAAAAAAAKIGRQWARVGKGR
jgi:hypothetical protein